MTGFHRRTAASALTATVIQEAVTPRRGACSPFPCLSARLTDPSARRCGHAISVSHYSVFISIIAAGQPFVNTNQYIFTENRSTKFAAFAAILRMRESPY